MIFIQIRRRRCLSVKTMNGDEYSGWFEKFYEAKSAGLILYGRALGLGHGEAEDVLQETFMALMQMPELPREPEHYCLRSFRNRALNHRRSLWRRLTRELEAARWFEKSPGESPAERAAMNCLARLPAEQREVVVLENLESIYVRGNRRAAGNFAEHGGRTLPLRSAKNKKSTGRTGL